MRVKLGLDRPVLRKVIGEVVVIPTFSSVVSIIEWGITGQMLDRINRLMSRTTLPSSVRPELPPAATRLLGKLTSRASEERNKEIPLPNEADS